MAIKLLEKIKCARCGEELDEEEAEKPRLKYEDEGEPICDDCWSEEYEYTCTWCEEREHIEHQHKLLVIYEELSDELKPGIYKILKLPYYTAELLGGAWIHEWTVKYICALPQDLRQGEYPCGHLCQACQNKIYEIKMKVIKKD